METEKSKTRILLIEDDEVLGGNVHSYLNGYQYNVDWEINGLSAWHLLRAKIYDMVLLDLELPRLHGIDILKNMRAQAINIPVIILTVHGGAGNRIRGLDLGADYYLDKPFSTEELRARIRCIQRRIMPRPDQNITVGNLTLNPETRLVSKSGRKIKLMRREFVLIKMFMENPERIFSRDQITQSLYKLDDYTDSNVIDVHIHNLRKKFGKNTIKTVRGIGYKLKTFRG